MTNPWEIAAVVLGISYLLLAMWEKISCWYAAFISTAIFLFLFWKAGLLMESALQVFYLVMAVYGWWQWRHGSREDGSLAISRWTAAQHALGIGSVLVLSVVSGLLLSRFTEAAFPYLDSFTTWGAMLTTWMVARKLLENWLYWIVIDSLSIYLYWDRELYLTAALFAVYVVIVIIGFFTWTKHYRAQFA
ncbi:MAG: nicotinamide riboside transporter PnuC [Pseudomonadota bacterium]